MTSSSSRGIYRSLMHRLKEPVSPSPRSEPPVAERMASSRVGQPNERGVANPHRKRNYEPDR